MSSQIPKGSGTFEGDYGAIFSRTPTSTVPTLSLSRLHAVNQRSDWPAA